MFSIGYQLLVRGLRCIPRLTARNKCSRTYFRRQLQNDCRKSISILLLAFYRRALGLIFKILNSAAFVLRTKNHSPSALNTVPPAKGFSGNNSRKSPTTASYRASGTPVSEYMTTTVRRDSPTILESRTYVAYSRRLLSAPIDSSLVVRPSRRGLLSSLMETLPSFLCLQSLGS